MSLFFYAKIVLVRFMKKIIFIFLSILMVFSLTACSDSAIEEGIQSIIEEKVNSLNTVDLAELGDIVVMDYDVSENLIALLHCPYVEGEEEYYDYSCTLSLFDIKKNRFIRECQVNANSYSVSFEGEYIQVWNDAETSELYDYSLHSCKEGTGKIFDPYDAAATVETIDINRFACYDSFADDSNYICYDVMVFYNSPENYYLKKHNNFENTVASYDKITLESSGEETLTLTVKDYENNKIINKTEIKSGDSGHSVVQGVLNERWACVNTVSENGKANKLYYWDYTVNQGSEELGCVVINDSSYSQTVEQLSSEIKEKYGINVQVNASVDDIDSFHSIADNKKNVQYLLCLYDLSYCLSTFPSGLYSEVLCSDLSEPAIQFNNFNIYLVGEIMDDNVDAFAFENGIGASLNIVYGCNAFNYQTFCHELMHIMEYRIWSYEDNFDANWERLNPDGFLYDEDYGELYYENEAYQMYFARDYGMKSMLEDRATVFETLCDSDKNDDMPPWWSENEPFCSKCKYLNDVLINAYPSLANENPWQNLIASYCRPEENMQ